MVFSLPGLYCWPLKVHKHSVVGSVTGEVRGDVVLIVVVREGVVGEVSVVGTGVIKEVLIVVNAVLS